MCISSKFAYKKVTQALNYFAIKEGGTINKLKALKLIFLADRYHLRKYGRLITYDEYFAMEWGPVASGTKDIAEASSFLGKTQKDYAQKFLQTKNQYAYKSLNHVDKKVLSESDIDALSFSWKKFGHLDEFTLSEVTHKYPEWKRHEKALKINPRIRMKIEDFLEDPVDSDRVDKCHKLLQEDKDLIKEHLQKSSQIQSFWG